MVAVDIPTAGRYHLQWKLDPEKAGGMKNGMQDQDQAQN